ncbi:MAG: hypothetical protein CMH48_01460 [Muricauda sp.]|nr:hypothetical protein [Allomuricauda sp.]MBC29490.1 hypothetical protein [Allomuricauda sp.]|tara:strand:- start:3734 stop:4159 length:426 start_codon:yes stop_codon:yes gene_type:complete
METRNHIEKRVAHRVKYYVTSAFKVFFMIIMALLFALLIGYVVMWLWNWLMPELFGLSTLTYWQAVGLLLLAKIFFGFGTGGPGKSSRGKKTKRHLHKERCGQLRRDFSEWKLYDEFWKEEGQEAYKAYVERANKNEGQDQ